MLKVIEMIQPIIWNTVGGGGVYDHLAKCSLEYECCWQWLTFWQPVRFSVSEDDDYCTGSQNISHCQQQSYSGLHLPNDHIPPFYERWSTCTSFSLTVFFGLVPAGTPLLFEVFWFLPGVVLLKSGCLGGVCVLCWVLENKSENQCYTEFLYLSIKCSLHVQHLLVMYRAYMCLLCHVFFSLSVMSVSFCLFCRCVCECS